MANPVVSSVFRPALFEGKSAIVTGGGSGIGKAIAQELLHLGCNVMISSRNTERLEAATAEMHQQISNPKRLEYCQCNIRNEDEVAVLVKSTIGKFGKIDFLVNNGGGQFPSRFEDISLKGWKAVIETNLTGTFLMCREVHKSWMSDHGGVIVNIIADVGRGFPMVSHSGAARSGVENLTKSLSLEWAPSGVRINAVAPSSVYSASAAKNYSYIDENIFEKQKQNIPAKRNGTTAEVSATVCFLLSPAAAFISGVSIPVAGARSFYKAGRIEIPDHNKLPAYTWEKDLQAATIIEKSNL